MRRIPMTLPICEMNVFGYEHEIDTVQGKFAITLDGRRATERIGRAF